MNTPPVSKPPKPSSKPPKPTPNINISIIESTDAIVSSNKVDLIPIDEPLDINNTVPEPAASEEKLDAVDLDNDIGEVNTEKSNIADMMQVHIPFEHGVTVEASEPVILSSTLDDSALPDNEEDEIYQNNGPPPYDPSALHDDYRSNYDDDDYEFETKSEDGRTNFTTQDKREHETSFMVTNSVADNVGVEQSDYNYGR